MKKIIALMFFTIVFLSLLGCSCNNTDKMAKLNEMMDKCGVNGITIVEEKRITKDKVIYEYDNLIMDYLRSEDIKFGTHIFYYGVHLLGDYVFILAKYTNREKDNSFIFCKIDYETLELSKILYYQGYANLTKINNNLLLIKDNEYVFYNDLGEEIDVPITSAEYERKYDYFISKDTKNNIVIYDLDFVRYEVEVDSFDRSGEHYNDYLFYYNQDHEYVAVNLKTNELYDKKEARIILEEKWAKENEKIHPLIKDKSICEIGEDIKITLDELRELNDYINITEEIFDCSVKMYNVIENDGVYYIAVANHTGWVTPKTTYTLLYKVDEEGAISYVGCAGSYSINLIEVIEYK